MKTFTNRVLIIHGTASLRVLYGTHLQQLGYKVVTLETLSEGVEYLTCASEFDVIFLASMFPYQDDLNFVLKTRAHFPDLPIVVMAQVLYSALPETKLIEQTATAFMFAPTSKTEFETVLKRLGLREG